jgi:hypothetical protein
MRIRVSMPAIIDQAGQPFNVDEADAISRRHREGWRSKCLLRNFQFSHGSNCRESAFANWRRALPVAPVEVAIWCRRFGLTHLFNHLVRPCQHRRRDGETERLGGLHIDDDQLDPRPSRARAGVAGTRQGSRCCRTRSRATRVSWTDRPEYAKPHDSPPATSRHGVTKRACRFRPLAVRPLRSRPPLSCTPPSGAGLDDPDGSSYPALTGTRGRGPPAVRGDRSWRSTRRCLGVRSSKPPNSGCRRLR